MARWSGRGWHPEDIKAAVRKRGKTLSRLATEAGLDPSATRVVWTRPLHSAEQAIASFLCVPAQELWPDRYDPDGTPRHPRARRRHLSAAPGRRPRRIRRAA